MSTKGCWTCRDRKVKCDLGAPTCETCRNRNLKCRGYGIRLSWPREGDSRRSIELKLATRPKKHAFAKLYRHGHFLNVTNRDIEMFSYQAETKTSLTNIKISIPLPPSSTPSLRLKEDEPGLLQYFMDRGSQLLILDNFGHLTKCILQLTFYDATLASDAVLNSLFTLSCLSLARTSLAMVYKVRALSCLQQSLRLGNVGHRTAQHLMACMLLYLCETFEISTTTKDWIPHMCGAKEIIISGDLLREARVDLSLFFDWISYHETFGRFGLIYWKTVEHLRRMNKICSMDPVAIGSRKPRDDFGCNREVLGYATSIFTIIMPLILGTGSLSHAQMQELYVVQAKLRAGFSNTAQQGSSDDELSKDRDKTTELYRISTLVYLNRAALGYTGEEPVHRNLVSKGLDILCGKLIYTPPWPVFILACEATEDSERMTALEILTKAGEEPRSHNMRLMRLLVEACWNQDDLREKETLDYHVKLRTTIRIAPYVPPFS
ncbi:fungal-specific transcription factor domain-containing protein [Trichoderma evansii]